MLEPQIIVVDRGFAIVHATAIDTVSLDDVQEITAYKGDDVTTDLVLCEIAVCSGATRQLLTLHEEVSGFDALMSLFETLPGFNIKWRHAVLLPPFATNRTTIYQRAETLPQ